MSTKICADENSAVKMQKNAKDDYLLGTQKIKNISRGFIPLDPPGWHHVRVFPKHFSENIVSPRIKWTVTNWKYRIFKDRLDYGW